MNKENLKQEVYKYWNQASCGTEFVHKEKFTAAYFEEIEKIRYSLEPEIFSFAQFTRFHGKKILEVGVGAGTDFLQWVRAGTQAYGIDLTHEAISNIKHRLSLYNVQAHDLQIADAEHLPYQDNSFDVVYSWGVIHHSPDTIKCLEEIIRVTKPGGAIKIMIYNRHSLFALYRYLLCGLFKGKPFRSFSDVLFYDQESLGTKAYTTKEIRNILKKYPLIMHEIKASVTKHDLLYYKSKTVQWFAYVAACLFGWNKSGFFMTLDLQKKS